MAFKAQEGGEYLITRSGYPLECYYRERVECAENTKPKEYGNNTIGIFSFIKGRERDGKV